MTVGGFTDSHVLRGINRDDCKIYLTPPVLLATDAFIYFKEYEEDKQFQFLQVTASEVEWLNIL